MLGLTPHLQEIDTSNWQTYRNDEFGFEVKYPAGYKIQGTGKPGTPIEGRESSPGYIPIA